MALTLIDYTNSKNKPFLFDRGQKVNVDALAQTIEAGRPIAVFLPNGKVALLVGDGTKQPSALNYIGDPIMDDNTITTVSLGGIPAGTDISNEEIITIIKNLIAPYQSITISSITLDQGPFEFGETFSGSLTVTLGIANPENLALGNAGLVSASPAIFPQEAFDPRIPKTITGINVTYNTRTTVSINVQLTDDQGGATNGNQSLEWLPVIWYGSSALTSIPDFATLKGLGGKLLTASRATDLTFTNNYSFIGIESDISTAGIGFTDIDPATGVALLSASFIQQPDLAIANDYGIPRTVKMFRSEFPFGGITKTRIS